MALLALETDDFGEYGTMEQKCAKILVIDDDNEVKSLISGVLADEGYQVTTASNEREAIAAVKADMPNLVFLDLWIGDDEAGGFKILDILKNFNANLPIVIISGHGTIDIAMNAMRKGAFDFLEKPFVIDRLLMMCSRALEFCKLRIENNALKNDRLSSEVFSVGTSAFATSIKSNIDKLAASNCRVFIVCPVGAGVESIAYRIHQKSLRKEHNFVCVSCIADDDSQSFSNELFGTDNSYGYIEKASGGTLFLENIDRLSPDAQRKLLMLIYSGKHQFSNRTMFLDTRIICSVSNEVWAGIEEKSKAKSAKDSSDSSHNDKEAASLSQNLEKTVEFNNELLYRLKISELIIPAMKERREDILPVIDWYMSRSKELFGLDPKPFSEKARIILHSYDWPGNIHQIKNTVENSLINTSNSLKKQIDESSLPPELTADSKDKFESLNSAKFITMKLKEAKDCFEADYLRAQMERFAGNISQTAQFIGMERSALHRKLKSLEVKYKKKKNGTRNNQHKIH